jgi:sugar phosphate isomerase/epimerase
MKTSRRSFLKGSTAALASLPTLSHALSRQPQRRELTGLQLYSVRDDMKRDALGTLKQLAAFGYQHVEHANYVDRKFYGWGAREFRKILDDLGLTMPSGHTVLGKQHWDEAKKEFTDSWKQTVEDAAILGQQFVISPSMTSDYRKSQSDLKRLMEIFNKSGELCRKSGMKFGYHNHDFEFSETLDGVTVYDLIMNNTDPALVIQQLDTGNLYNGGANAMAVAKKYPGRFSSMHVKDEIQTAPGKFESTILGKGIVPVKDLIDLGRKSGTLHFIVEQEAYQGRPPLDCVKEDLAIMRRWGY